MKTTEMTEGEVQYWDPLIFCFFVADLFGVDPPPPIPHYYYYYYYYYYNKTYSSEVQYKHCNNWNSSHFRRHTDAHQVL